jgi:Predicted nucleoside-diphosphate sugar epimerases
LNDLIERDKLPRSSRDGRFAGGVVLSALLSVAFMRWLPMFVLFFSVPIFFAYFTLGKRAFVLSVFLAFAMDLAVTAVMLVAVTRSLDGAAFAFSALQSIFLFFPLFCLLVPGKLRIRYRLLLAGTAAAAAWFFLIAGTGAGVTVMKLLREITADTANMLYSMIPEGYERTAFQAQLSPDALYTMMVQVLSCSFLPLCVVLYALGYLIASAVASVIRRDRSVRFRANLFYVEYVLFIPLAVAMSGVMGGKLFRVDWLWTVSWNVLITSGLFFMLQGYGILSFFLSRIRSKMSRFLYFLLTFGLVLFTLEGWPVLLGLLLIAGVVELFVPLRARFVNKDVADPTPGNGNDHNA